MYLSRTLSLLLFLLSLPGYANAGPLVIDDARVHEAPPTISILAAYLNITNTTGRDVVISEITSPEFERVEIHETVVKDDVATMVHRDKLYIPAGASVNLQPGGKHLMLFNPARPIRAGDQIGLSINLSEDNQIQLMLDVIKPGNQSHEHHHH